MKKRNLIYYVNGEFVPEDKATISVRDLGLIRGYGIFDFLVTYNGGIPFKIDEHVARFMSSSKLIGLSLPWSADNIKKLINKTIKMNPSGFEKTVKIIATGGESLDGITVASKPTLIIMIGRRHKYPPEIYSQGVSLITLDHKRDNPKAKSLDYAFAVNGVSRALNMGSVDFIYVDKKLNRVFEASRSNIFIVKNKKVISPSDDSLKGITQETVIKMSKRFFSTLKKPVKIGEIYKADEIFLTSSDKEIVPVVKVDNRKIGAGIPGPVTKKLMSEFEILTQKTTTNIS